MNELHPLTECLSYSRYPVQLHYSNAALPSGSGRIVYEKRRQQNKNRAVLFDRLSRGQKEAQELPTCFTKTGKLDPLLRRPVGERSTTPAQARWPPNLAP